MSINILQSTEQKKSFSKTPTGWPLEQSIKPGINLTNQKTDIVNPKNSIKKGSWRLILLSRVIAISKTLRKTTKAALNI